jgi:hypothetical protein
MDLRQIALKVLQTQQFVFHEKKQRNVQKVVWN